MSNRSRFYLDKYCYDNQIDIIAVQETNTDNPTQLHIQNMSVIMDTNKASNKGSALFVNNNLNATPLPEISLTSGNIDSAWALVSFKNMRIIMGSIYVKLNCPDAISDTMEMLKMASVLLKKHKAKGIVLAGDFNARSPMWGNKIENSYGKKLIQLIDFQNYSIMTSDKPTFFSPNGDSNIDMMIVSNGLEDRFSNISTDNTAILYSGAPVMGHVPIHTKMKLEQAKPTAMPITKVNIDSVDWRKWSVAIEHELHEQISDRKSPQEQWDIIDKAIHNATVSHSSTKISTVHSKPYWTNGLSVASIELRKAMKNYTKRNTSTNIEALNIAKDKFEQLRKRECGHY